MAITWIICYETIKYLNFCCNYLYFLYTKRNFNVMEKIKKNWHIIVIFILLIFGLSKCTQSCNRQMIIDNSEQVINQKDSVISVLKDSIVTLNHHIDLLNNDNKNYQENIKSQQDAINKITEAKKNINVTVKKQ